MTYVTVVVFWSFSFNCIFIPISNAERHSTFYIPWNSHQCILPGSYPFLSWICILHSVLWLLPNGESTLKFGSSCRELMEIWHQETDKCLRQSLVCATTATLFKSLIAWWSKRRVPRNLHHCLTCWKETLFLILKMQSTCRFNSCIVSIGDPIFLLRFLIPFVGQ